MRRLTSYERVANTLSRKPVDHIPAAVDPWGATVNRWVAEGHLKEGEDVPEHFDQDIRSGGWLKSTVDLDFQDVVIEETDETILKLDGNGAKLRTHKLHDSTPEHVDFTVKDRVSWEEFAKPRLLAVDRRRIPFEKYREARAFSAQRQRFFCWAGVAPFEQMHPLCGHEHMLMGMALDPDWVKDMVTTYVRLTLRHLEILFGEEGKPNGFFVYEDMGFKHKPFMSPAMYREIIEPGHKLLFDFAHSLGCKVIVHSCGFVEPLVPGLIKAGMDCLQAMEVKAGMDMRRLAAGFGDRISFFGNIDVRTLIANDRALIEAELLAKIPPVLRRGCGYILHTDHSEPPEVNYETMRFFLDRGREIGTSRG
ncbi:MAG: uroporphyrinogen decarboxylase family protein [Planctomycetota bacterium]